jgi:hypothetical protein
VQTEEEQADGFKVAGAGSVESTLALKEALRAKARLESWTS